MSEIVLERLGESLVVRLGAPHRVLSWALCGGGLSEADAVVWCQVRNADLPVGIDPVALLTGRLAALEVPDAVGMLTSRSLAHTHTALVATGTRRPWPFAFGMAGDQAKFAISG